MQRREFLKLGAMSAAGALCAPAILRGAPTDGLRHNQLRGIMIDAARLTELPEHYQRVIDFCQEWKLDTILFRLTDDQGSAFRFQRHPELITHDHALSPSQARELAAYAHKRGVTLIPEIESFGHTSYITSVSKWAGLADTPPGGRSGFVGISPVHRDALPLMRDLFAEVAAAFPSRFLHAGCDEVNWGGSDLSKRALETRSRAEIWADYLNGLHAIARELGRELIVWGDFVVHKEPEILPRLDKRIIVMDWQYYVTDPKPLAATARQITGAGLRAIGAPALISCEWGPRAGAQSLANVDAFVDAYSIGNEPLNLGVIVTNWIPGRYLAGSLWDSFAYTATSLVEGVDAARRLGFQRFMEGYYGATWNAGWRTVFSDYYRLTPGRTCTREWTPPRLPLPSASDEDVKRSAAAPPLDVGVYQSMADHIRACGRKVRRHQADLESFTLSADYIAHVAWREQRLRDESAANKFDEIARRDAEMVNKLDAEWNLNRYADSTGKTTPYPHLTAYDQLLLRMKQAAEWSRRAAG